MAWLTRALQGLPAGARFRKIKYKFCCEKNSGNCMETESHEYFYISTQMRIIVCLFFVIALCYTHALDCNSFDYSQIKLVTFDVFAALMDVISSTSLTVSEILSPWLPESDGRAFALAMVYGYSDFADHVFTEAEVLPLTFSLLNQQLIEIWPC
jgi:hypothetical protein